MTREELEAAAAVMVTIRDYFDELARWLLAEGPKVYRDEGVAEQVTRAAEALMDLAVRLR